MSDDEVTEAKQKLYMGIRGSQGRRLYLFNPKPEDFDPEDTARALSNEHRYAGNYGPYSVAQHSVLVARVVEKAGGYPPQVLAAVHHDDTEMITGDLPQPVKAALRLESSAFDRLEERLEAALEARYHIDISDPIVKWADKVVFYWEVHRLIPEDARWMYSGWPNNGGLMLPYQWFIPWAPAEAFARYMDTHLNASTAIEANDVPEDFKNAAS